MAVAAGLTIPQQHVFYHVLSDDGVYPPLANEWAKGNAVISGWLYLGSMVWPEPGMIVGHPSQGVHGHVGIVDFDGEGIGAGEFLVTRKFDFLDGDSGFNRYIEEDENEN